MTITITERELLKQYKLLNKSDEDFITDITKFILNSSYTYRTKSKKLTHIKNYVRDNKLLNDIKKINLIKAPELRKVLIETDKAKSLSDITPLDKKYIDLILSFKDSVKADELLIFLLFSVGRRITEFLNGKFTIRDNKLYINKVAK